MFRPTTFSAKTGCLFAALGLFVAAFPMAASATVENEYAKASVGAKRQRMALIVGNATYPADPLPNASRDALTMDDRLRALGFSVERHLNLNERDFKFTLREFWARANRLGGDAVFFYAGHGVGVDGRNLLLPVDTDVKSLDGIRLKGIDLMDALGAQTSNLNPDLNRIVILDSCRNDPARRGVLNGKIAGFFVTDAPSSLISFSTSLGKLALDGPDGSNSHYTKHLAKELLVDEIEASVLFTRVRNLVQRDTAGRQIPVEFNTLRTPFVFRSERSESLTDEEAQIKKEVALRTSKGLSAVPDDKIGEATEQLYRAISLQLESEEQLRRATDARAAAEARAREARLALSAQRKLEEATREQLQIAADAESSRVTALKRAQDEAIAAEKEQQRLAKVERDRLERERLAIAAEMERAERVQVAETQRAAEAERQRVAQLERERIAAQQAAIRLDEQKALIAREEALRLTEQRAAQVLAEVEQAKAVAEKAAVQSEEKLRIAKEAVATSERNMREAVTANEPPERSRMPRVAGDGALLVRGVKLPAGLRVIAPVATVPAACRAFSGGWSGVRWADVRTAELWVESVSAECTISVVYAYGGTSVTGSPPNFQRIQASVENGEARLRTLGGSVITIRPTRNRTLTAVLRDANGGAYEGEFEALVGAVDADDGLYAFEHRKTGVEGVVAIRATNLWGPIPDSAPAAPIISTLDLDKFIRDNPKTVLVDTLGEDAHKTIVGAILMPDFGRVRLPRAEKMFAEERIAEATGRNKSHPIVVFERNTRFGWLGYHALLRLIGLGYTNVRWYRGGLDAWHDAGLALN